MSEKPFVIGYVAGAHGLKGDVRVFPVTDDIKRFELLDEVTIELKGGAKTYKIEKLWYHKRFVMLRLEGVADMNGALALKGGEVKIEAEKALPLSENEYYVRDLLDMDVYNEAGGRLGKITDVLVTGANDVYEVDKRLLLPAIRGCILNVDVAGGKMTVKLPEGLE